MAFVYLFILPQKDLHSQSYDISYINTEHGLPHRWINKIGVDSSGFMWFGTRRGLAKWDGNRFINYDNLISNANQLTFNEVQSFVITESKIWVVGEGKLNTIDIMTNAIEEININAESNNYTSVSFIDGHLWLKYTTDGQYRLARLTQSSEFETIIPSPLHKSDSPRRITIQDKNHIWFTDYNDDLFVIDLEDNTSTVFEADNLHNITRLAYWNPVFDTYGKVWFPSSVLEYAHGVIVDKDSKHIRFIPKDSFLLQSDLPSAIENFKLHRNINHQIQEKYGHELPNVKSTFRAPDSTYWVGTYDGVYILRPRTTYFRSIHSIDSLQNEIGNQVRGITETSENELVLSTDKGLVFYDPKADEATTRLRATSSNCYKDHRMWYAFNLVSGERKDQLYLTLRSYLGRYDITDGYIHKYIDEGIKGANKILEQNGKLYIGVKSGVAEFDMRADSISNQFGNADMQESKPLFITDTGDIYVGCRNGLFVLNLQNEILRHYHTQSIPALNNNFVYDAMLGSDGKLWVGTKGGLQSIDESSGDSNIYTTGQGLANNIVANILEDSLGYLWVATFDGLSRFNIETEIFENFYIKDGISHNEFNNSSKYVTHDGNYVFGTLNGATYFDPLQVPNLNSTAPLRLTKYTTFDKKDGNEVSIVHGLESLDNITVSATNKYFRFEYALLDYTGDSDILYSYFLEGYDDEWGAATASNTAQYNNLPAGEYTFHVRASAGRGKWSTSQKSVDIRVKQIFYKQLWFILLVGISFLSLVYAIYKYRLNQALKLERLRTKIASDLHDEVGSIMTKISMSSELLKMGIMDKSEQESEINQISENSRAATSTMSDVIWSIDARADQFGHMLSRMQEHAEELLTPREITFEFVASGIEPSKKLEVEFRQNIYLIYREAINNIVKHSNALHVEILLQNTDAGFYLCIHDNGTQKSHSVKTGQGKRNMVMRAKRLNGNIKFEQQNGYKISVTTGKV